MLGVGVPNPLNDLLAASKSFEWFRTPGPGSESFVCTDRCDNLLAGLNPMPRSGAFGHF